MALSTYLATYLASGLGSSQSGEAAGGSRFNLLTEDGNNLEAENGDDLILESAP